MRDIPCFETEYGTVGLVLNQIPYTKTAYIHIRTVLDLHNLIVRAVEFCVGVGAEKVYATGNDGLAEFPLYVEIIGMQMALSGESDTDACLMPLTDQNLEQWLSVYNERMANVDCAAHISFFEGKKLVRQGGCYFVHHNGDLLGIGRVDGGMISCLASVQSGMGTDVVLALCHAITSDKALVEVASTNIRAIKFYERLGFVKTSIVRSWYQLR